MHGMAQEYVKPQKASKLFQDDKGRTTAESMPHKKGVGSSSRRRMWSQEASYSFMSEALGFISLWKYYLNPALNRHAWSAQEEIALIRAHQIHGAKWSELSKLFPGRTAKAIQNHWNNNGMKRKLNSYLTGGLLEEFQNLPDGPPVLNNRGSSRLKGNEDSSKNSKLPSDFLVSPKSEQGLTETGENATTLVGKSSDSVSAKGVDDRKKMVCQMDTSKFPAVTYKKIALSPSSVDLKVCVAAPSSVRSVSEEKKMSSCPPEVQLNCANTLLSPGHSLQSTDAHLYEICSSADKELTELHEADIADLLDMSYCESLMIVPPDSPRHI
uniref:Uncharacterized protein n=1 Tax=Avena sativa TaxID=4498 RepID=A0ACD5YSU9_AVESA